MTKRTGKGSGKPAPEVVLNGDDISVDKPRMGAPSIFTQDLAAEICRRIAFGKSLRSVCRDDDMPEGSTVFKWLHDKPDFAEQYTRACEERSEAFGEDILEISDDGRNDWMTANGHKMPNREVLERSKLRVETRKWLMAKMKPRKYGEKVDLTSDGKAMPIPILGGASLKIIEPKNPKE